MAQPPQVPPPPQGPTPPPLASSAPDPYQTYPPQPSSIPSAYQGYQPMPTSRPATNGMATAGLVVGIIAVFVNTLFIPALLGIVFSSIGMARAGEIERSGGGSGGKGMAIAGLICSIVAVLNSLLWKWAVFFLI